MIHIEAIWLATEPIDMRAGVDTALGRVVKVFGAAQAHHAYLFANRRANRMKVLVHDGFGLWLCARRLHQGHFVWPHSTPTSILAHARRKFVDLQATGKSLIAETAVRFFVQLHEVEREVRALDAGARQHIRKVRARPLADALHA